MVIFLNLLDTFHSRLGNNKGNVSNPWDKEARFLSSFILPKKGYLNLIFLPFFNYWGRNVLCFIVKRFILFSGKNPDWLDKENRIPGLPLDNLYDLEPIPAPFLNPLWLFSPLRI